MHRYTPQIMPKGSPFEFFPRHFVHLPVSSISFFFFFSPTDRFTLCIHACTRQNAIELKCFANNEQTKMDEPIPRETTSGGIKFDSPIPCISARTRHKIFHRNQPSLASLPTTYFALPSPFCVIPPFSFAERNPPFLLLLSLAIP